MEITVREKLRETHSIILDELGLLFNADQDLKEELFQEVKRSLIRSLKSEEIVIYKHLLKKPLVEDDAEIVAKLKQDHHEIKDCLQKLILMKQTGASWSDTLARLTTLVIVYYQEEERFLFSRMGHYFQRPELVAMAKEL